MSILACTIREAGRARLHPAAISVAGELIQVSRPICPASTPHRGRAATHGMPWNHRGMLHRGLCGREAARNPRGLPRRRMPCGSIMTERPETVGVLPHPNPWSDASSKVIRIVPSPSAGICSEHSGRSASAYCPFRIIVSARFLTAPILIHSAGQCKQTNPIMCRTVALAPSTAAAPGKPRQLRKTHTRGHWANASLQTITAAIRLTASANRPTSTAWRAFLIPTAPKYTART